MRETIKIILRPILGVALLAYILSAFDTVAPEICDITKPWLIGRPPYITSRAVEVAKSIMAFPSFFALVYQLEFFADASPYSDRLKRFFGMLLTPKLLLWALVTALYFAFAPSSALSFFFNAVDFAPPLTRAAVACLMLATAYCAAVLGLRKSLTATNANQKKGNEFVSVLLLCISLPMAVYVIVWMLMPIGYNWGIVLAEIWLLLVIMIALVSGIRILLSVGARRRLFKQLYAAAAENGFEVQMNGDKYRSLFRDTDGESFSVSMKDGTVHCKLLPTKRKYTLMMRTDGSYGRVYNISLPRVGVLCSWERMHKYGFEADGRKVLIISPCVSRVSGHYVNRIAELDNGDKVGEYTVYTAKGFVNALSRGCI